MRLRIRNFKSIREMDITLGRVNVIIGPMGTGKSNILEALGMLGRFQTQDPWDMRGTVRHRMIRDLFHGQDPGAALRVSLDTARVAVVQKGLHYAGYGETCYRPGFHGAFELTAGTTRFERMGAAACPPGKHEGACPVIRFYRFRDEVEWDRSLAAHSANWLTPPDGRNLPAVLANWPEFRESLNGRLQADLPRLSVSGEEGWIRFLGPSSRRTIEIPDYMAPDSMVRLALVRAALETNRNAVVVMEEPEERLAPEDIVHTAERIGLDDESGNVHVLSTRSNRFLMGLVAKTRKEDLNVLLAHHDGRQTLLRRMPDGLMPELFERNALANFDYFLEETLRAEEMEQ